MKLKLRIYDSGSRKMLYAREPNEQGNREYYPFLFPIGFSDWSAADLSEPMVCTGRTDKHGTPVYEGDILGLDDPEDQSRAVIVFRDAAFKAELVRHPGHYDPQWATSPDWIVIGNIYENPELLEKAEKP